MAEAFKNLINADTVRSAAHAPAPRLAGASTRARFEALALDGLDALEFKARAMHLCAALEATLPEDFDRAAGIIEAALAPPGEGEDLSTLRSGPAGLAGWVVWPLGEYRGAPRARLAAARAAGPARADAAPHRRMGDPPLHRKPPRTGLRHAGRAGPPTPAPTCAGWSAKAAARACPGGCS